MRTILNEDATKIMKTSVVAIQRSNPVFYGATGARWFSWQKSSGQNKSGPSRGFKNGGSKNTSDNQKSQHGSRSKSEKFEKMKTN